MGLWHLFYPQITRVPPVMSKGWFCYCLIILLTVEDETEKLESEYQGRNFLVHRL